MKIEKIEVKEEKLEIDSKYYLVVYRYKDDFNWFSEGMFQDKSECKKAAMYYISNTEIFDEVKIMSFDLNINQ